MPAAPAARQTYITRLAIATDMWINVLWGGQLDQTFSYRCAVGWRQGKPFWCFLCKLLSMFVQRNHCADQFNTAPTPWYDMARAGFCFALVFLVGFGIQALIFMVIKGVHL